MNDIEKKEVWNLITSRGDFLKGKLKDDPMLILMVQNF